MVVMKLANKLNWANHGVLLQASGDSVRAHLRTTLTNRELRQTAQSQPILVHISCLKEAFSG